MLQALVRRHGNLGGGADNGLLQLPMTISEARRKDGEKLVENGDASR